MQGNTGGEQGGDPGEGKQPKKDESFSQPPPWGLERDPRDSGEQKHVSEASHPRDGGVQLRTRKPGRYWLRATVLEVGCARGVTVLLSRDIQPVLGMCRKASHSLRSSCRVLQREADTDAGISPEDTKGTVPWVHGKLRYTPLGAYLSIPLFHGFPINFIL